MNIEAISRVVSTMSVESLRALNRIVVDRINNLQSAKTWEAARAFRPGDMVEFTATNGRRVQMEVERINTKTISGTERVAGRPTTKWRASPGLCTRVGAPVSSSAVGPAALLAHAPTTDLSAPGAAIW